MRLINSFSKLRSLTWLALAIVVFVGQAAVAQLSNKDIADLKKEAVDKGWTFTVDQNEATEYTLDQLCGTRVPDGFAPPREHINTALGTATLPSRFDWRDTIAMPPIRNQGGCGSCWAFSTIGAMECAIKLFEHEDVNLSEQWLVSCNRSGWSCNGGWLAFDYLLNYGDPCGDAGAVMETAFPYTQSNGTCHCPYQHPYKIDNYAYISSQFTMPTVAAMKQAIMQYGPISVCVTATSAFQGYHGGIFNEINESPINHAVVLVGWDDSQGPGGVWFLRNSWGSSWGEGGYMRIMYNVCNVGYGAAYMEYGGIGISADTKFGPGPDTVNFVSNTTRQITGYAWEFGDGATSTEPNPAHSYAPGCYNVKLTVQTPTKSYSVMKTEFIELYADTLKVADVASSPGKKVRVDISSKNCLAMSTMTIPITWAGTYPPALDSGSLAGTRAAGATLNVVNEDPVNKRRTYQIDFSSMTGSELGCGEGPILSLYFRMPSYIPAGYDLPISVTSYGWQVPTINTGENSYTPETKAGKISICLAGDFTNDNQGPDIEDLSALIAYLYLSGPAPAVPSKADIDGTVGIDIGDITALISYLYLGGAKPTCGS